MVEMAEKVFFTQKTSKKRKLSWGWKLRNKFRIIPKEEGVWTRRENILKHLYTEISSTRTGIDNQIR